MIYLKNQPQLEVLFINWIDFWLRDFLNFCPAWVDGTRKPLKSGC